MFIENSLFKISPPTKEDLISIRDLYTNLLVMKFIPNSSQIWNIQSVEAKIKKFQNDTIGIHVVKTHENEFIGEASIFSSTQADVYEIGFILHNSFWGKGFGTVICLMLIKYCINFLNARKVIARMYKENIASQKVCLNSGMHLCPASTEDIRLSRLTYVFSK